MDLRLLYIFLLIGCSVYGQTDEEIEEENAKALLESKNLTWEANKKISEDQFVESETDYRKAISKSDKNAAAPFNLGNAYYNKEIFSEAFGRFKQAGEVAEAKPDKHKAYHNMGNVFMKRKEYEKAVEAYKEALRNNPKDEETRYNLALAKEMLKKQQDEQKQNDENKDDQNQEDKKDQQDQNQDQKDGDKNEDEGDQKEEEKENEGDKGDEEKEENKEGQGDKKEEQEKKPEQELPPRPNQLSKQQIQNLLDAMQNEEKKVQEKIDAKKVKGVKIKNEKDW